MYAQYIVKAAGFHSTLADVIEEDSSLSPVERLHRTLFQLCPELFLEQGTVTEPCPKRQKHLDQSSSDDEVKTVGPSSSSSAGGLTAAIPGMSLEEKDVVMECELRNNQSDSHEDVVNPFTPLIASVDPVVPAAKSTKYTPVNLD